LGLRVGVCFFKNVFLVGYLDNVVVYTWGCCVVIKTSFKGSLASFAALSYHVWYIDMVLGYEVTIGPLNYVKNEITGNQYVIP
jgi:hypothetical protein